MTVQELIDKLLTKNLHAQVRFMWEGDQRGQHVVLFTGIASVETNVVTDEVVLDGQDAHNADDERRAAMLTAYLNDPAVKARVEKMAVLFSSGPKFEYKTLGALKDPFGDGVETPVIVDGE